MNLISKNIIKKLTKSGYDSTRPYVKLFVPWTDVIWYLSGISPDGICYGFIHRENKFISWGKIDTVKNLELIYGPHQQRIQCDTNWTYDPATDYRV
jgi:hypothetical protein